MASILMTSLLISSPGLARVSHVRRDFSRNSVYHVPRDFSTIQEAIDSDVVRDGDTIKVGPGSHCGAVITKAVKIQGKCDAVIDCGPLLRPEPPLTIGFFFEGDGAGSGAEISHLRFKNVEFPVFSRGADNVTVSHCSMLNPIQGVSNWHGSNWIIRHNVITDLSTACGGGIGILLGERSGGSITCNLVSHNKIKGTLYVKEDDCGGYNGTGIVLYADFRWGYPGAENIAFNYVIRNRISLTSDTPDVVDVCAIELTDTRDDPYAVPFPVIHTNIIGFNNLRGTEQQIVLTPEDLAHYNFIFRNRGDTRCWVFY
ncbi:MAG: hypothetical protein ACMUIL_01790 [bacterium]